MLCFLKQNNVAHNGQKKQNTPTVQTIEMAYPFVSDA